MDGIGSSSSLSSSTSQLQCVSRSGIKTRFIAIDVGLSVKSKDMRDDSNITLAEMSHCFLFVQCRVWILQMCRYYAANGYK